MFDFKSEFIPEMFGFTMEERRAETIERSSRLVCLGWWTFFILYSGQVVLLEAFLVHNIVKNGWYVVWFGLFLPAPILIFLKFICTSKWKRYAYNDERVRYVWIIWGAYIVAYVITVAVIFGKVSHKLTKDDDLGINTLIVTLCMTPVLLILLLQLTISPSYQKLVLSSSMFAALNIFDGIKMLEIFLMQNEAHFDLNTATEICIVVFACICFFLSFLELVRNKFMADGVMKMRKDTSMIVVVLEIFLINLPFLVLRAVIWRKYETAIFMVKNIVALVIGVIEFLVLKGVLKWGGNATGEHVHHI